MRSAIVAALPIVCVLLGAPAWSQQTPDAQKWLAQYLDLHPEADTDHDGILTRPEWERHATRVQRTESIKALGGRVKVIENIEYASVDGQSLKLDLFLPTSASDRKPPLVVWIHGGGWHEGSKERCLTIWLVGEGYAVASVDYRLTDKAIFPAQIHDCKGAVRWLRAHAKDFGYDPDRIAASGESAGGHLAALMGASSGVKELEGVTGGNLDQSSKVQAVIDLYGPTDFALYMEKPAIAHVFDQLLGKPWSESHALADLASPTHHVTADDAPILILHGAADTLVPLNQSQHLHDLYQKAGLSSQLLVIEGAGHTGPQFTDPPRRAIMKAFLDKYLKP